MIRLASDIGGTFTDLALDADGTILTAKLLTTPARPEEAVLAGTQELLTRAGISPAEINLVIHGTTLATNAIIERKGARTAFVSTQGFTDMLDIGHENRFEQYDLMISKPKALVPRRLRFGLTERIDVEGNVAETLRQDALEALDVFVRDTRPETLAVCLLHSYINSEHEQKVAEFLSRRFPEIPVSLSSAISPIAGEYERASTTCANAYVRPIVVDYFRRMEQRFIEIGCTAPVLVVMSEGGLASISTACEAPVRLIESGPAGGATLAVSVAHAFGIESLLSFDMGGTTAKICMIDNFVPEYDSWFEVDRTFRFQKGSGLPLRIPVVDLVEIGAGGGSIGHIDTMGRIQVGPESAGSDPGPAAYGFGGMRPTITDANLLLEKLDPNCFAGGRILLDKKRSSRAFEDEFSAATDMGAEEAAAALVEVVEENMANAARVHAIEKGKDISEYTMVAFGGGGPLHAARIAQKIGVDHIIIPPNAGVGSAVGFLAAPVSYTVRRTSYHLLSEDAVKEFPYELDSMIDAAERHIADMVADGSVESEWKALMRYEGQGHNIEVNFAYPFPQPDVVSYAKGLFEDEYARQFGRILPSLPIEIVGWVYRKAVSLVDPAEMWPDVINDAKCGEVASARFYDVAHAEFVAAKRFKRDAILANWSAPGPFYLSEEQTTSVVPDGFDAKVDGRGFIHIRRLTREST